MNSTKQIYGWLTEHDELTFVACDDFDLMDELRSMGITVHCVNYDIKYENRDDVICADAVFDEVEFRGCVVHWNCEKTFPLGKLHTGEFILRGDHKEHNGDCNPIHNHTQLMQQNGVFNVYAKDIDDSHVFLYGNNLGEDGI